MFGSCLASIFLAGLEDVQNGFNWETATAGGGLFGKEPSSVRPYGGMTCGAAHQAGCELVVIADPCQFIQ